MKTGLNLEPPSRGVEELLAPPEKTGSGSAIAAPNTIGTKPIPPPESRIDQDISMNPHSTSEFRLRRS
jgi:hypothetical protein